MRFALIVLVLVALFASNAISQSIKPTDAYVFELRGRVVDRFGKPIPAAQVDVFIGGGSFDPPRPFTKIGHGVGDEQGRFVLRDLHKPDGTMAYTLRASAAGMAFAYLTAARADEEALLVLNPAETIRGRVIDDAGGPVSNAEVLSDQPIDDVRTNERGEFVFDKAPSAAEWNGGIRMLRITHPDFVIDRAAHARYCNDDVIVRLRRGIQVTGRLTDIPNGAPIHYGAVKVEFETPANSLYENQYYAWCDDKGRYTLRVPADLGEVKLRPLAVDSQPLAARYEPVEPAKVIVTDKVASPVIADFTFKAVAVTGAQPALPSAPQQVAADSDVTGIRGRVLDEQGQPIAMAHVCVIDLVSPFLPVPVDRPVMREPRSDLSGLFEAKDMDSEQSLLVIAWDPTRQRICQTMTTAGNREVELRITERASTLAGIIRDEDGHGVAGVPLCLRIARRDQPGLYLITLYAVTDARGHYEMAGYHAPPEGYQNWLIVESPFLNWDEQKDQHVSSGSERYVHFPVKPGEVLDGLDYTLVLGDERVAVPVREEFTHEP